MKRRWPLVVVLAALAAAALTARWWLAPSLAFLGEQGNLIRTLGALTTILGSLAAFWAFLRRPRARDQARIDQLRDRIRQLAAARGAMDATTVEALLAECRTELRKLTGSDLAAAQAEAASLGPPRVATATPGGVVIVGDVLITGDGNRIPAGKAEPELLFDAYLGWLANDCNQLPLAVIDTEFVRGGGEATVRLPEVYVELDVTAHRRPSEDEERDWAWRLVRGEEAGRRPVLEALAEPGATRHVLLGDPGSGKTTFANYLCHLLASPEASVPAELKGLVPVRFVLRDVAARHVPAHASEGTADMLWSALRRNVAACVGDEAADALFPFLQNRLLKAGGFIVLDGLDEVPEAHRRREVLLAAVAGFAAALGGRSRVLVTARPYAYADPRWHLTDFAILALAPFSHEQVGTFIERWYLRAARRIFAWSEEVAAARSRQLRSALEARPYLGDLASRPLLLTLMATLHSSWGQLPEDRADLYEETVKLLLSRWQRAREVRDANGKLVTEESISQVLAVEESRLRQALEAVAFAVHERQGGEPERGSEPADIPESDLLVAFKPLLGDLRPDDLWCYLRDRAGLLISRREGVYAFPHRSFQEYLAACHLARLPEPSERLRERAFADLAWWREVVLLGIGRRKRAGLGDAAAIVAALQPADPAAPEKVEDDHWRVAVLCGQALLELRLAQAAAGHPVYEALLERARRWLVALVGNGRLSARERLEAGDVLGRLGDPRPGVGILPDLVPEGGELPDVGWVEVPPGTFTMGTPEGDPLAWHDEDPAHQVFLERYWISRYPITNRQFRPFCAGDGYTNGDYWTQAGREWLEGAEADVSAYPEHVRDEAARWLAGRPKEKRREPFFWEDPKLSSPSRPVVGVTWYEAVAYCRWLEARLRALPDLSTVGVRLPQGAGWAVSLPSEAQWEKAARGQESNRWPWGNEFDESACNSSETGLDQSSAVGIFPKNTSPYGVVDLVGNVWEWTSTIWSRSDWGKPDHEYPYTPTDGREEMERVSLRIFRGGSYFNDKRDARCAARGWIIPEGFDGNAGVRVVFSLANSDS